MPEVFSRSFLLLRRSFAVLRKDKEILLFPLLAYFFAGVIILTVFPLILVSYYTIDNAFYRYIVFYSLIFLFYFLLSFIYYYFMSGAVTIAYMRFHGLNGSFKDGIENSNINIKKIIFLAIVSGLIQTILAYISEKFGKIGKFIAAIFGTAWEIVTFFIIQTLLFEEKNIKDSLKSSGYVFKKTWGESATGEFSLFAVFIIPFALLFLATYLIFYAARTEQYSHEFPQTLNYLFFPLVLMIGLLIFISSLMQIYKTALYIYATTGKVVPEFGEEMIKEAFTIKQVQNGEQPHSLLEEPVKKLD